jgi:hypothetical protein
MVNIRDSKTSIMVFVYLYLNLVIPAIYCDFSMLTRFSNFLAEKISWKSKRYK